MAEKRKFKRIDFREPVQILVENNGKNMGCLAQDLSEGGIKVSSFEFIPVNCDIQLQAKLSSENFLDLKGKVIWIQKLPFSDRFQIGFEFREDYSFPKYREEIRRFIQSHQLN